MKKILLIDYYGMCDKYGRPVGHSSKVLKEYGDLLKEDYEVSVAVSPCLIKSSQEKYDRTYELKYDIYVENGNSVQKRILDKWKLFFNIKEVLKIDGYDLYWFYKTDFFLFFFFCFRKKKGQKKLMAQIYQGSFGSGGISNLINWFYHRGMSKFDGITYSQIQMPQIHSNMLYFPDYYFDQRKYGKYRQRQKEDKVVCLGTMNPYKKLDQLIDAFNCNGYRLEIRGYFFDKDYYRHLSEKIKKNIVIEDKILAEEEYYRTLAEAKYTILPYDMGQYQCRTSGILVESMFLDTIAIAPAKLLEVNQMKGMGYDRIEELADPSFFDRQSDFDNDSKKREFDRKEISIRLKKFIDCIQNQRN